MNARVCESCLLLIFFHIVILHRFCLTTFFFLLLLFSIFIAYSFYQCQVKMNMFSWWQRDFLFPSSSLFLSFHYRKISVCSRYHDLEHIFVINESQPFTIWVKWVIIMTPFCYTILYGSRIPSGYTRPSKAAAGILSPCKGTNKKRPLLSWKRPQDVFFHNPWNSRNWLPWDVPSHMHTEKNTYTNVHYSTEYCP